MGFHISIDWVPKEFLEHSAINKQSEEDQKKVKHIHFVGIGGAGMIGIAKVLLKKGYKISGSDISDSHELKKLEKHGAKVFIFSWLRPAHCQIDLSAICQRVWIAVAANFLLLAQERY